MTTKSKGRTTPSEPARILEKKWGKNLIASGWTAIPNIVLEKQHAIGLKPTDVCILLHLVRHWWVAGEAPYPSKKRIAQAIGVDPRTVQRRIEVMESQGFIKREERRTPMGSRTNRYHLDGLIEKLKPFAMEAMKERKTRETAEKARLRRKTPLLEVVQ